VHPLNKYQEFKTRLSAIEVLILLKKEYTYKEICSLINLPTPVLSRYVNGHILPSIERAEQILSILGEDRLVDLIRRKIRYGEDGILDHSEVIYDSNLLDKIGGLALKEFSHLGVEKVLTVEVDGIPLATEVARKFNVGLVVAKARKEMGIREFVDVKKVYTSGAYTYLFVPKGSIKKEENVLLVDDVVRTGSTVDAMLKICEMCRANAIGLFTLISVKPSLLKLRERLTAPIVTLVEL